MSSNTYTEVELKVIMIKRENPDTGSISFSFELQTSDGDFITSADSIKELLEFADSSFKE